MNLIRDLLRCYALYRERADCFVGSLYQNSSVLMQRSVVPLASPSKFTHNDDYLILEDESGRVKLTGGAISASMYVTGMCSEPSFVHVVQWICMGP